MIRRLRFCAAATAAIRQSGAVRAAAAAPFLDGMAAAEGGFKLSSVAASFLEYRVNAPAIRPPPFPTCFIDFTDPFGSRSSFIVRPQPQRRRFFSTDARQELTCSKKGSQKDGVKNAVAVSKAGAFEDVVDHGGKKPHPAGDEVNSAKAAPFGTVDNGVNNAKQEGCVGDVVGAKAGGFEYVVDHGGKEQHPAGDGTGVNAVTIGDEVASVKAGDQIGVESVANGDGEGFKAEGDEVTRAKAEASKCSIVNADLVAGAKAEEKDGMADEVASAKADASEGVEFNGDKKHRAGDQIGVESVANGDGEGFKATEGDEVARAKAEASKCSIVNADLVAGAKAKEKDGMADEVASAKDDASEGLEFNGDKKLRADEHAKHNTGDDEHAKHNTGDKAEELLRMVPAAKRRFRRTSKAKMNMAAHFANHRSFVLSLVNRTSSEVIETTSAQIKVSVFDLKKYIKAPRVWNLLASFVTIVLAGMVALYHGVNYLVEELEAKYEEVASSDFTKNKAKEIMQHAAGSLNPLRLIKVVLRWPWFGGAEEEQPLGTKPKKKKRSILEWFWSVFGFGGDK